MSLPTITWTPDFNGDMGKQSLYLRRMGTVFGKLNASEQGILRDSCEIHVLGREKGFVWNPQKEFFIVLNTFYMEERVKNKENGEAERLHLHAIAHEFAHIVLGLDATEEEVNDKAKDWGFEAK